MLRRSASDCEKEQVNGMKKHKYFALALGAGLGWALMASAQGTTQSAAPTTFGDKELFAALMTEGAAEFPKTCAMCHGPEGAGLAGPALRQNVKVARGIVKQAVNGSNQMPPVAAALSDRELAALVTYIRNSWGNEYGMVTEEEVHEFRKPVQF